MTVANPKQVAIYRAKNALEAHVIRMALEDAGIRAQIDNEVLQSVAGELPNAWAAAPRIQVDETHARIAREIIDRVQAQRQLQLDSNEPDDVTHCLSCGNTMSDDEVKCSSCGWSFLGEETTEQT